MYSYLATCRFFRRLAQNGSVALGGIYYYINPKYRGRAIEVTFDGERALFRGQVAGIAEPIEIIPRGLTKEALMGEAGAIAALPVYQLALLNARSPARDGLHSTDAPHYFMRLSSTRAARDGETQQCVTMS